MARFVAFDVETPNRWNDRMSAIGITIVEDGEVVEEFYSLVDPEEPFDSFNVQLTGIDEQAAGLAAEIIAVAAAAAGKAHEPDATHSPPRNIWK